eukprot:scaffold10.g2430.t1
MSRTLALLTIFVAALASGVAARALVADPARPEAAATAAGGDAHGALLSLLRDPALLAARAAASAALQARVDTARAAPEVLAAAWRSGPTVVPLNGSGGSSAARAHALATLPDPMRQPAHKWSAAAIANSFTQVPKDMLNPLIPYAQQFPSIRGCPNRMSILSFGGVDDSETDISGAIGAASASSAATLLFLPSSARRATTAYRVARSARLTKPLLVGCGARLEVAAGVTLTVTAQPRLFCAANKPIGGTYNSPIFTGEGHVVFEGPSFELAPNWWAAGPVTGAGAAAAVAACGAGARCTLMLTKWMWPLDSTLYLNHNMGVFSSLQGSVNAAKRMDVLVLRPGAYTRQVAINTFTPFTGAGIVVQARGGRMGIGGVGGGVRGARILVGQFYGGQWNQPASGVVFRPNALPINNVQVQHIVACPDMQSCVAVEGSGSMTNVQIDLNFAVKTTGLRFRGACPSTLQNVQMRVQARRERGRAFDPAGLGNPEASVLRSDCQGTVSNLVFELAPWAGGFVNPWEYGKIPGQLVQGRFANLSASFSLASNADNPNLFRLRGSPELVGMPGRGPNPLSVNSAGMYVEPVGSEADALGPSCCFWTDGAGNRLIGAPQRSPLWPQALYVRVPVAGAWAPGAERRFYFRSWWTATATHFTSIPFRAYNPGLFPVAVNNRHVAGRPYVVEVVLRNVGRETIDPAAHNWHPDHHRFGLQLGPN